MPRPRSRVSLWSWGTGHIGARVLVHERTPGGPLWLRFRDPLSGKQRREPLRHRDRALGRKQAQAKAGDVIDGLGASWTLGRLVAAYELERIAGMEPKSAKWVRGALRCWQGYLGADYRVERLGAREWEDFQRLRLSGELDPRGQPLRDPAKRRPARAGSVNLWCEALRMLCNWATRRRVNGVPLLKASPIRGLAFLDNPNPRRAVWTTERYTTVLQAAEAMREQRERDGVREWVPCPLADVLVLAWHTGRRVGAIRQLRFEDLRLDVPPHGAICWPAGTDKAGKEWLAPISAEVRDRLMRLLQRRGFGPGYLFPAARLSGQPVQEDTLRRYLREAAEAVGDPLTAQDGFHGLRRAWVTSRKHLPDKDVAEAGGWRSIGTMRRAYQQADWETLVAVVGAGRALRASQG